ncbi:nucleolar protein 12-like [Bidens hawaiensis]|uniref:nucleolar protein 12-like n=1 Tax=Bidens hawaiensis TaxID=980011 RepID=UPI0040490637
MARDEDLSVSSIFKSLFGNTRQQTNNPTSDSIFSDSNPFRIKPTNQSSNLPQIPQLNADSDTKSDTQIPNSSNKPDPDDSHTKLDVKKTKSLNLSAFKDDGNDNKKKKKRKKAEIEAEYEERKYGGVDLELNKDEGMKVKIGEKKDVVPKEGFDDDEKLSRTVFIGNLPLKVRKKALMKEFNQFGEIESVRIRSIPLLDDKTPRKGAVIKKQINDAVDRVNAYIVFKTEDSAQASLSHNMAVVGGNHIHVDRACPPRKKLKGENAPLYDSKRTVFIGNLPFDVKDEELYQLFTGFNNLKDCIEAIRVVRDPGTSMGKGIAYVLFTTRVCVSTHL